MSDGELCETPGCYRQTDRVMIYEVWEDGLSECERRICEPCEHAMRFRETFTQSADAWYVKAGQNQ